MKLMMSDLIRRSDAIKALRCEYPTMPMFKSLREEWAIKTEGFRKAEEVIMSIPSADRPQGEWIDKGKSLWKCSNCEMVIYSESEQDRNEFHKWCSRCGSRMKGADDE